MEQEHIEHNFEHIVGLSGEEEEGIPDKPIESSEQTKNDPISQPMFALLIIIIR